MVMGTEAIEKRGFYGQQVYAGLCFSERAGTSAGELVPIKKPRWVPETSRHGGKHDSRRGDTGLQTPPLSPR